MQDEKDLCPVNESGNHRYFIFRVVEVFEPIANQGSMYGTDAVFHKVEYALQGCNCGSVVKAKVKQQ